MATHPFVPGDRLVSKKSGRVYVYALEDPTPPADQLGKIPVRMELWAPANIAWFDPNLFNKVDDDYHDAAKDDYLA